MRRGDNGGLGERGVEGGQTEILYVISGLCID